MRVGAGAGSAPPCGVSGIGVLALAFADAGLRAGGWAAGAGGEAAALRVVGAGLGGGALAPAGMPPLSAGAPFTAGGLIRRGSLFGIVPFTPVWGGGPGGGTLATGGGLLFGFSGGNTTRGAPDLALTSTGVSSRDTSFSPPSPC